VATTSIRDAPTPGARTALRVNLLAPENGGQVVLAPGKNFANLITGDNEYGTAIGASEAVFAFKDEHDATFDTFAVLIPGTYNANLKEFELSAASESPTGPFALIGTFQTQNVREFKSPYQEFKFPAVRAKYLKVRFLSSHEAGRMIVAHKFRLMGHLE
jgi:hypothetical protein